MRLYEILLEAVNLQALFRRRAWYLFQMNMGENEFELEQYLEDYENETGNSIEYPPGQNPNERGADLTDRRFAAWCKAEVERRAGLLAQEFEAMFQNGMIRGYRVIEAPPNWKPRPPNPGQHWSRDPAKAFPHFALDGPGMVKYMIEADIPVSSIDWDMTLKANLSEEFGDDEDEISIKPKARVNIISVKPYT